MHNEHRSKPQVFVGSGMVLVATLMLWHNMMDLGQNGEIGGNSVGCLGLVDGGRMDGGRRRWWFACCEGNMMLVVW